MTYAKLTDNGLEPRFVKEQGMDHFPTATAREYLANWLLDIIPEDNEEDEEEGNDGDDENDGGDGEDEEEEEEEEDEEEWDPEPIDIDVYTYGKTCKGRSGSKRDPAQCGDDCGQCMWSWPLDDPAS